jgi:hypothetical protein
MRKKIATTVGKKIRNLKELNNIILTVQLLFWRSLPQAAV